MNNELGIYLNNIRKDKNLSLEKVATKLDISASYLYRLETGERRNPSANVIKKICEVYCISPYRALSLAGFKDGVNVTSENLDLIDYLKATNTTIINGKIYNSSDVIQLLNTLTSLKTA